MLILSTFDCGVGAVYAAKIALGYFIDSNTMHVSIVGSVDQPLGYN